MLRPGRNGALYRSVNSCPALSLPPLSPGSHPARSPEEAEGRKRVHDRALTIGCDGTLASPRGRVNLNGHARLMLDSLGALSACTWLRKADEPAPCTNAAAEWPLSHLSQLQTRDSQASPQALIKAALCLYKGGGLDSAAATAAAAPTSASA